jgi:hypothetical protein
MFVCIYIYILKYIRAALISEPSPYMSMFANFKRVSRILYGYISFNNLEYNFKLTNNLFNNQVTHKLIFIKPNLNKLTETVIRRGRKTRHFFY